MKRFNFLFFAFFITVAYANPIDSLKNLIYKTNNDSVKANLYLSLSYYAYNQMPDSIPIFVDSALKFAQKSKLFKTTIQAQNVLGYYYKLTGEIDKALKIFKSNLYIAYQIKDSNSIAAAYGNIANCFTSLNILDSAVFYYKKALQIFERERNIKGLATVYGALGNLYLISKDYKEAVINYSKAIELLKNVYRETHDYGYLDYLGVCYMNKAVAFKHLRVLDSAITLLEKSIEIFKMVQDNVSLNQAYANIAEVYYIQRNYKKAIQYSWIVNEYFLANKMYNDLLINALRLANSYLKLKKYDKALKVLTTYQSYLDSAQLELEMKNDYYFYLAKAYYYNGYIDSAYKYILMSYNTLDSIVSYRTQKNVQEALEKFKAEQKQKEIEFLQRERQLQQKTIRTQKLLLVVFFTAFLVILIYSVILMRLLRQIRLANRQLRELNAEIMQQKEEILAQKEEIERQNRNITESIQYASRIQTALLPRKSLLNSIFPDNFIFFRPRDYVSGDFYWFYRLDSKFLITVGDCTGHGVPGSLMSMLGLSFLSEIVKTRLFSNAADVLDIMRSYVKEALKQGTAEDSVTKDGIDMALVIIDLQNLTADFAGAYNPLIIVRDGQMLEYKGDKMPVGIHFREKPHFKNHIVQLQAGDMLYLFSDGYIDQFGEQTGKKFLYKRFKQMLLEIADLAAQEQVQIIARTFEEWKGGLRQVDDVTVLGFRITNSQG